MPEIDPDAGARETLRLIGPDPQNWVPDQEGIDHNVLIVGGGQSGSTFAFALRRAGIGKVSVIDAAQDQASAGVWLTSARMQKLRTPKTLPGPELGLPGLSFQAWYEARHGVAAHNASATVFRALASLERIFGELAIACCEHASSLHRSNKMERSHVTVPARRGRPMARY